MRFNTDDGRADDRIRGKRPIHCVIFLVFLLPVFGAVAAGTTEITVTKMDAFQYTSRWVLLEHMGPHREFVSDGNRILRYDASAGTYVPFHDEEFRIISVHSEPINNWLYYRYGNTEAAVPSRVNVVTRERQPLLDLASHEGNELYFRVFRDIAAFQDHGIAYLVQNPENGMNELWYYSERRDAKRLVYASERSMSIKTHDPISGYLVFVEGNEGLKVWTPSRPERITAIGPETAAGADFVGVDLLLYTFRSLDGAWISGVVRVSNQTTLLTDIAIDNPFFANMEGTVYSLSSQMDGSSETVMVYRISEEPPE